MKLPESGDGLQNGRTFLPDIHWIYDVQKINTKRTSIYLIIGQIN
jgi:hypothetical protein